MMLGGESCPLKSSLEVYGRCIGLLLSQAELTG